MVSGAGGWKKHPEVHTLFPAVQEHLLHSVQRIQAVNVDPHSKVWSDPREEKTSKDKKETSPTTNQKSFLKLGKNHKSDVKERKKLFAFFRQASSLPDLL